MTDRTRIEVLSNAEAVADILGEVAREQIPYATAKALNDLAFDGMRAAKSELAQSMTLRNRFSQSGIQVNKADKHDWPNVQAEVGIEERRSYLIDHVTGGQREGGRHGRAILADTTLRNPRGRVPKRNRPGALIARSGKRRASGRRPGARDGQHSPALPFMIYSRRWGNEVLVRRLGTSRYPLEILYAFRKHVAIRREFEMDLAVQRQVQANYNRAFGKALQRALRTAKPRDERAASRSRGGIIERGR